MAWHANVSIRCNGKLNDTQWEAVKKWPEVDRVWSTMGDWDFWLETNDNVKTTEDLEKFVFKLRKQDWVASTSAHWWREL